jgi:hypothetical protein
MRTHTPVGGPSRKRDYSLGSHLLRAGRAREFSDLRANFAPWHTHCRGWAAHSSASLSIFDPRNIRGEALQAFVKNRVK